MIELSKPLLKIYTQYLNIVGKNKMFHNICDVDNYYIITHDDKEETLTFMIYKIIGGKMNICPIYVPYNEQYKNILKELNDIILLGYTDYNQYLRSVKFKKLIWIN